MRMRGTQHRLPTCGAWIFLAVIGGRPGAMAAALKTWIRHAGKPFRTVLLATPYMLRGETTLRLKDYVKKDLGIEPEIIAVSTDLAATGDPPSVIAVANDLKDSAGNARLAFYADPGLKYMVAALAHVLGRQAVYLHADTKHLVCIDRRAPPETSSRLRLENIGLDNLLSLHGLTARGGSVPTWMPHEHVPPSVLSNAVIRGGTSQVTFNLLQERRGWLLALHRVSGKEDVRALERLPNVLNGLHLLVSACTANRQAWERAGTVGLAVIACNTKAIDKWIRGDVAAPGQVALPRVAPVGTADRKGREGTGPPLLVWVGPDPSSTLRSLYTFTPSEALVLYDGATPASKRSARRLMGQSSELPCGRIYFQESDLVGRRLSDARIDGMFRAGCGRVIADISPGTNGQACATALLPGVELWSQRMKDGKAVSLHGTGQRDLQTPPALVQARIRGGRLCRKPVPAHDWTDARKDLLCRLACDINRVAVGVKRVDWGSIRRLTEAARKSGLSLRRKPAGAWFEEVVAGLCAASGADEVWLNVKWAWARLTSQDDRVFRDEIDLLVRRGGSLFVVSCKLKTPNQFPLEADASETEAVTRDGVGRLAIPVLVRLRLDPTVIAARRTERRGAIYLDLGEIASPGTLGKLLDRVARSRRTT